MGRFVDRVTGRSELTPEAIQVIKDWADASKRLMQLVELGSVITPRERTVVLTLLHVALDTPEKVPPDLVDDLFSLDHHLKVDDEHAERYASDLERAQEIADRLNEQNGV